MAQLATFDTWEKLLAVYRQAPASRKASWIGWALAATVLGTQLYKTLVPPSNLPDLPTINYFRLLSAFLRRDPPTVRSQQILIPALEKHKQNKAYLAKLPLTWTVFIVDPVAAKMFLMKMDVFPKIKETIDALDSEHPIIEFFGRENVAISVGEAWRNQRKIMNPAFRRAMPISIFGNLMFKVFENIKENEPVVAIDLMQAFTLDALGRAAFSFDFHALDDQHNDWVESYEMIRQGLRNPVNAVLARYNFITKYLIPGRAKQKAATHKLNSLLLDMAGRKRAELEKHPELRELPDSEKDLLTLMVEANMESGDDPTSAELLRANLSVFFLAGHDTTANTLSFWLYHMAMNKDVQAKAREEVIKILGDGPEDVIPTSEQCKQMTYLDCIIKENLRLLGPASQLIPRIAMEDVDLNGVFIPKGTRVTVDMHTMHYSPMLWQDPEVFNPDRFLDDGEHSQHRGLAWLPFSSGGRQCLGMNFSLTEQRVVMSMMLRKYTWELPADSIHRDGIKLKEVNTAAPRTLSVVFQKRQR